MNVLTMTDAKLAEAHERLSGQRTDIVAEIQAIHDEQERRLHGGRITAMLEGLSPEQRTALREALGAGKDG